MDDTRGTVLVVARDAALRATLTACLGDDGYAVAARASAGALQAAAGQLAPDVIVLELSQLLESAELPAHVREVAPQAALVAVGGPGRAGELEQALRLGADRYLPDPADAETVRRVLRRAMERPVRAREAVAESASLVADDAFAGLVGAHPQMQQLLNRTLQAARSRATVLVHGETGTGKELIAAAIHRNSSRAQAPFVRLNCAALAESVLESELFGHERGAFTGASAARKGRFEQAHGGTLFLDEVSEVPLGTQVKLLRFLQERELERVGGNETLRVDARVVAATNRDLRTMVDDGTFREDLFFRLNVVRLEVPPLRARASDIPLLAEHFLQRFAEENEQDVQGFSEAAVRRMLDYPWPGNVRELQNVIEQAVVLASGPLLEAEALPLTPMRRKDDSLRALVPGVTLAELERYAILRTLESVDGSRAEAAAILGISRRTLQYRLQEWGIEPRRGKRKDEAGGG